MQFVVEAEIRKFWVKKCDRIFLIEPEVRSRSVDLENRVFVVGAEHV
jgi:hypothetical protein